VAKQTLLAIVQDILSDMDSDEVNSVSDTSESLQVAQIVKTTYEGLMVSRYWEHLRTLFQLSSLADTGKRTYLQIPESVMEVELFKYDKRTDGQTDSKYTEVTYLPPDEFLLLTNARNLDSSNVDSATDASGIVIKILNDHSPTYWTSFNGDLVVCDSYDSAVEGTLQGNKTQLFGLRETPFTISDSFIPDLPAEAFPYLLSESKSICFERVKQLPSAKEEQRAMRQSRHLRRKNWRASTRTKYPNYGRK
jgi:hypothetical protein